MGSFDQLMLRPVSVTLQVFGSEFILRRIGRVAQALAILAFAFIYGDIAWTIPKLLYLPVIFISNICFFGGLFVIGATITFWTVESIEVVNIFTYGGTEMMSYPMNIYPDWMIKFFTFIIPAIFLNYYPALYILGRPDPLGMPAFAPFLAPVFGPAILLLGFACWNFGLRHYQSTGS
jgi:ABC-2 type transport system permease protein